MVQYTSAMKHPSTHSPLLCVDGCFMATVLDYRPYDVSQAVD